MILAQRRLRIFCGGLVLISLLLPVTNLLSAENALSDSRKRLADLEKKIETTLQDLHEKRSESGDLDKSLKGLQAEIRRIDRMVKQSDHELSELETRINGQKEDFAQLESHQRQAEFQVRKRLAALYKTGEIGLLKVMLSSAETPRALIEKYEFLSRMARHDRELIEDYRQRSRELKRSLDELQGLRRKQETVASRRLEEQQALKSAQSTKRQLLAKVRKDEKVLDQMLKDLRAKAARLNDLVKKLESDQVPSYTKNLPGLATQKGRLPWPVSGPVRVGFGTNRHGELGTLIESNGLEISTPIGAAVTSIASGKVLFAKRLRGYGKLLIIDHGNKDYSLYAHVDRFVKELGDQVTAGELIAYTGYEGRDYIYFEIRHSGKPIDPQNWLKPR